MMQTAPPMSPPAFQPAKKQRAGNTPEHTTDISTMTDDAMSRRRAELQMLQGMTGAMDMARKAAPPVGAPPIVRPPSSVVGAPPIMAPISSRSPAPLRGGGRSFATLNAPRSDPLSFRGVPGVSPAPPNISRQPLQPPRGEVYPNTSPKIAKPGVEISVSSPKVPLSVTSSPKPSPKPAASATAAAIKAATSPKSPRVTVTKEDDASLARRLEFASKQNFSPAVTGRSKSAPPRRPPPPPPAPPLSKEAPPAVIKSVGFQVASPPLRNETKKMPAAKTPFNKENLESTTPEDTTKVHAGVTPFHPSQSKMASMGSAGQTPFHSTTASPSEEDTVHTGNTAQTPFHSSVENPKPTPQSMRRDLLLNMREAANTPPEKSTNELSSELRLQKELARAAKEKAGALRQVAKLEDEVTQLRSSETSAITPRGILQVGFISPVHSPTFGGMSPPLRRRMATPCPKRSPKHAPNVDDEKVFMIKAVECCPFEYESEMASFIVRRPYGLATERDLWLSAGQVSSRLYTKTANVGNISTMEVLAKISVDDSYFLLYNDADVQHKKDGEPIEYGNVEERTTQLGTVTHSDKDENDKVYSLDDLYEATVAVRQYYCSTVLATATGLQMQNGENPIPSPQKETEQPPKKIETCDKAVATEELKIEEKKDDGVKPAKKSAPPPAPEESTDLLGVVFQTFFSTIFGMIWFVFVTIPIRILTTTFVMSFAIVLLSLIWLYLVDDNGATEIGAPIRMYSNRPGIL